MLIPIGKAVYCLFFFALTPNGVNTCIERCECVRRSMHVLTPFGARHIIYSLCSIRILVLRCLDILVIQQKGDLLSFEYVLRLAFIVVSCIL